MIALSPDSISFAILAAVSASSLWPQSYLSSFLSMMMIDLSSTTALGYRARGLSGAHWDHGGTFSLIFF
jgi:hypothetical protein